MRRLLGLGLIALAVGAASAGAASRPVSITSLAMVDATHGYALGGAYGNYRLLRPSDGGRDWTDVTPTGARPSAAPALAGATTLLLPAQLRSHVFQVLRSDDAGRTWTRSRPFRAAHGLGIGTPAIADTAHAFVAIDEGAAAGSQGEALYASSDGGRTWRFASGTTFARVVPGRLPFGCDKTGFGFATAQRGWAGGNCAGGRAFLYRTDNAGRTWRSVRLPGLPECECNVSPPQFFTPSSGALTVFGWAQNSSSRPLGRVYWTSDGGVHWRGTAARWGRASQATSVAAPGAAWVVTAPPGRIQGPFDRVFVSADGGRSWQTRRLPFDAANYRLDAVSASAAFAYSLPGGPGAVFRTLDGGRTWHRLATALSG